MVELTTKWKVWSGWICPRFYGVLLTYKFDEDQIKSAGQQYNSPFVSEQKMEFL